MGILKTFVTRTELNSALQIIANNYISSIRRKHPQTLEFYFKKYIIQNVNVGL